MDINYKKVLPLVFFPIIIYIILKYQYFDYIEVGVFKTASTYHILSYFTVYVISFPLLKNYSSMTAIRLKSIKATLIYYFFGTFPYSLLFISYTTAIYISFSMYFSYPSKMTDIIVFNTFCLVNILFINLTCIVLGIKFKQNRAKLIVFFLVIVTFAIYASCASKNVISIFYFINFIGYYSFPFFDPQITIILITIYLIWLAGLLAYYFKKKSDKF